VARYRYVALSGDGQEIHGEVDSISEAAARDALLQRNLVVQRLDKARRHLSEINVTKQRIKPTEIMHFSRQLGAFVRAGIPLTEGLDVIADGVGNKRWREMLLTMREEIATGVQFSDALAPHESVLPPYYLGIIRSAELTGRLDTALEQLSVYMERDFETRQRIKSALTYPSVVLFMSAGVVVVLAVWVLPKFANLFGGLGARKLPWSTQALISVANFMKGWWFVPLAIVLAIGTAVLWLTKNAHGKRVRDRLLLHIPIINDIVLHSVVERVCRILAAMSQAAVPLPDAMAAAIEGANHAVFEDGLRAAQERMLEGEGLAAPIGDSGLFPRAAVQMMRVGEDTGTLYQQLDSASAYYARELDYKLKRLTTLFEPAVIILMGLIVGFVALALVQAMYGIYNSPALTGIK
jgi:type IV pilus assembly protein PilC